MNIEQVFNKIKKVTVAKILIVTNDDKKEILNDIEEAKEDNLNYVYCDFDLETIKITWDKNSNYEIENASKYNIEEIKKVYAISSITGESPYYILNTNGREYQGQKIIDRYSFYGNMTKKEIIKEMMDNNDDERTFEDFEKIFDEYFKKTEYGYIEIPS